MTYARARLRVGISGVGTVVVVAVAALGFDWPWNLSRLDSDLVAVATVLGLHVLLLAWMRVVPQRWSELLEPQALELQLARWSATIKTGVRVIGIAALSAPVGPRLGAWHVARTALYLSWAGFGLLSRAVHCNSGRPELWALLPCD